MEQEAHQHRRVCAVEAHDVYDDSEGDTSSAVVPDVEPKKPQQVTHRGWLTKFSLGRSRFGRSNFKRRFFVLSGIGEMALLGYYENEQCAKQIGSVALSFSSSRLVTTPTPRSHPEANGKADTDMCLIFAENGKERRLLLRADSAGEKMDWLNRFDKVVQSVDRATDM
jgi:hypothetical protein